MAKKKSSLADSLGALAQSDVPVPTPSTEQPVRKSTKQPVKPSRKGTTMIGAHMPREVSKALNILAAEEERSNKQLLAEALNLLFERYGKPSIAPMD